jgi:hypothetical protein
MQIHESQHCPEELNGLHADGLIVILSSYEIGGAIEAHPKPAVPEICKGGGWVINLDGRRRDSRYFI